MVRRFALQNKTGNRLNLMLKSSFFYSPTGLGFAEDKEYISTSDGFFYEINSKYSQPVISGQIIFLNLNSAYADYRKTVTWINKEDDLKLVYCPYGSEEYFMDVKISEFSKSEITSEGYLACDVTIKGLSPWFSQKPLTLNFQKSASGTKRYAYSYGKVTEEQTTYGYIYGVSRTPGSVDFQIDGDFDGGIEFTAQGLAVSPILTLKRKDNAEIIGQMDLTGTSVAQGEKLIFSSVSNNSGIWLEKDGERENIIDSAVLQEGVELFFKAPRNTSLTLSLEVSGTIEGNTTVNVYSYWKTR